jgi:transposase
LHPLYLPRDSPELNPAEQIFRHVRKTLSNRLFTTLDELQNALIDALQQEWRASDGAHAAHRLPLVGRGRQY